MITPDRDPAKPLKTFPMELNSFLLCSLMNFSCSAGEYPKELLTQILKLSKCLDTVVCSFGKSSNKAPTWLEKSQMIKATIIVNSNIGKKTAMPSGSFNLLKKRNSGKSVRLKKNAINNGIIIIFPVTMIVPKTNRPISSMARFTVTGISFTFGYD